MSAGVPIPKFASIWARRFANFGIDQDTRAVLALVRFTSLKFAKRSP